MNGFKFVRNLLEISAAVNVSLMSAFELNSDELSGLGYAKIDGFIQKLVSLAELNNIIQKQLEIMTLS
jgi:hypothetical protein